MNAKNPATWRDYDPMTPPWSRPLERDFVKRDLERPELARLSNADAFITGRRPFQLHDFTHCD